MLDWKEAKKQYDEIPVPEELSERLEKVILAHSPAGKLRPYRYRILLAAAAILILFITELNVNTGFAAQVDSIPVLGQISRIFVFKNYVQQDERKILNVTVPELKNTGNDDLENRVNNEIRMKINEIIREAEKNVEECMEAYLKTGGNESEFTPWIIDINYEIKCSDEQFLSFEIWKTESLASSYFERYFYNIDLETGKELTLRDLLGPDYVEIATAEIKSQIEQRTKTDPDQLFYDYGKEEPEGVKGFEKLSENQMFYINKEGNVVIVFEKYSIAPGYMGCPEFVIR